MTNKPFDIDLSRPSDALLKQAKEELRETAELRVEAITELRALLHENKDLYYADDDEFLMIFLRPCKFYPQSAIKLVSPF